MTRSHWWDVGGVENLNKRAISGNINTGKILKHQKQQQELHGRAGCIEIQLA